MEARTEARRRVLPSFGLGNPVLPPPPMDYPLSVPRLKVRTGMARAPIFSDPSNQRYLCDVRSSSPTRHPPSPARITQQLRHPLYPSEKR
jgi:hypothetical protein